ncbi:hypothetical protein GCM10009753_23740 [Streptantibioticus ferralitis]
MHPAGIDDDRVGVHPPSLALPISPAPQVVEVFGEVKPWLRKRARQHVPQGKSTDYYMAGVAGKGGRIPHWQPVRAESQVELKISRASCPASFPSADECRASQINPQAV